MYKMETGVLIVLICVCLIIFYLFMQNNWLQTSKYDVSSKYIEEPIKIIQISDYHNVNSDILTNQIIKRIKKEKPDIIVVTGDLVDANRFNPDKSLCFMSKITNIAPIYYVTGNHEASIPEINYFLNDLEKYGVEIIDNKKFTTNIKNNTVNIFGLSDPGFSEEYQIKTDDEVFQSEIEKFNISNNELNILLSHHPENILTYSNYDFDLVFSGHAHGGQFRLPFIGGLYAPNQGILPKYTSGQHKANNTNLLISRGLGNSKFPFRINNRPEIVVVNIERGM